MHLQRAPERLRQPPQRPAGRPKEPKRPPGNPPQEEGALIASDAVKASRLSKPELARRLLVGARQVDNYVASGMPLERHGGRTWFRWEAVFPWFLDMKIAAGRGRARGEDGSKARLEEATAKLAELKLAREERLLVAVADVGKAWADMLQRIAGKLATAPGKYAARCVGLATVGQAVKVLDAAVQEVLAEISDAPRHE